MRKLIKRSVLWMILICLLLTSGCRNPVKEYLSISSVGYSYRSLSDENEHYDYFLKDRGNGTCLLSIYAAAYESYTYIVPDTYLAEMRTLIRDSNVLHWGDMTKHMTSLDGVDITLEILYGNDRAYVGSYLMPEDVGEETLREIYRLMLEAQENAYGQNDNP